MLVSERSLHSLQISNPYYRTHACDLQQCLYLLTSLLCCLHTVHYTIGSYSFNSKETQGDIRMERYAL